MTNAPRSRPAVRHPIGALHEHGSRLYWGFGHLNGAATNFSLTGTIYAPTALAQIIAYDVQANGNGGAINVPYGAGVFFHLKGIGLVR